LKRTCNSTEVQGDAGTTILVFLSISIDMEGMQQKSRNCSGLPATGLKRTFTVSQILEVVYYSSADPFFGPGLLGL
jgi:hypothetical protein